MKLNEAIAARIRELCAERDMTQYKLYLASGVPQSALSTIINCTYPSMKAHIIYEVCEGLGISLAEFFASPLFERENIEE